MKTIQQDMIEQIYSLADLMAKKNEQTVGEKNDFYITLEQLERILKSFED